MGTHFLVELRVSELAFLEVGVVIGHHLEHGALQSEIHPKAWLHPPLTTNQLVQPVVMPNHRLLQSHFILQRSPQLFVLLDQLRVHFLKVESGVIAEHLDVY